MTYKFTLFEFVLFYLHPMWLTKPVVSIIACLVRATSMKPYTALPGVATNHFFQNVGQSALSAIAIDVQKVGLFPVDLLFGVVFWKWDKILSFKTIN